MMRYLKHLIGTVAVVALLLIPAHLSYASDVQIAANQNRVVRGIVLEQGTDMPLVGVSVYIEGTTLGTATDMNGEYQIRVTSNDEVLMFSFIGKVTERRLVGDATTINMTMRDDVTMLEEFVFTGYMTQRKADLTGSISVASRDDLIKNPSANAMKALQGKMAGVHITTNGGNPAESVNIQIRGLSSLSGAVKPLIVLDGMPTQNLNLRDINSGDIESIQVLKDAASASIYGARASGGVILIQTKKGVKGKVSVEYDGSVSFSEIINRPKLMNAQQYGIAAFRAAAYDEKVYGVPVSLPTTYDFEWHRGEDGFPILESLKPAEWLNKEQTVRGSDTNWMREIFQTALMTNHQLTVSSGTDNSKSLFSFGYYDNEGTQINTFFRQYSVRTNSEYNLIGNRLKIGENLAISYLQYRDANETWSAMINPPAGPVYDINGNWAGAPGFDDFGNPVRVLTMYKDNKNNYVKIIGDIFADLRIWRGLSVRTQFGVDYGNAYNRAIEGIWSETGGRNSDGENYVGSYQSHPLSYVWTNTLSYSFTDGAHSVDAVAGSEFTRFVQEGFSARREGVYLEDRDFAHIGVTTGDKYSLGSSADEYAYFSLFAKANYAYDSKYLFSATVRRDGSSLFGQNHRYGVFPAFSAGWRLSDESFMEDLDLISDLKLRAGWGANGSVQGLPRGYTTTPFTTNYFETSYPIEGNETGPLYSGYRRTWLGNPDLKWETTTQTDIGLDWGLLNQRIRGSFSYYFKKTNDILVQVPYIAVMGEGGEPWINGANMNNRGLELEIAFRNDPANQFKYTISANVGSYRTKLVELPENVINRYPGDGINDLVIGKTPHILYGLVADGIFKSNEEVDAHAEQTGKAVGRIRYKDLDGNGVIDELYDRTYIGITDPDFFGGVTFDLSYQNFDLNIFFQGVYGNKVHNEWKNQSDMWNISVPAGKNHETRILEAWYFDNLNSDIPAITNINQNAEQRFSSYYVEDGSYLKLRNVELGYTLPTELTSSLNVQHLRIYSSARNLLTLKKGWGKDRYTSFDPEMHGYGYLTPFTIAFGINVIF